MATRPRLRLTEAAVPYASDFDGFHAQKRRKRFRRPFPSRGAGSRKTGRQIHEPGRARAAAAPLGVVGRERAAARRGRRTCVQLPSRVRSRRWGASEHFSPRRCRRGGTKGAAARSRGPLPFVRPFHRDCVLAPRLSAGVHVQDVALVAGRAGALLELHFVRPLRAWRTHRQIHRARVQSIAPAHVGQLVQGLQSFLRLQLLAHRGQPRAGNQVRVLGAGLQRLVLKRLVQDGGGLGVDPPVVRVLHQAPPHRRRPDHG
mmetsp:Transcript_26266/g.66226  ORF Transcript_26266/g.66226 Transcript_26266/m.66226 type:complete len:259 (-) Transcript_26266:13802-14578(-)